MTLPESGPGEAQEQQAALLPGVRPYGARSDESVLVGDLLMRHVPALARGDLEIVAIARHQSVLSKVAVRRRRGMRLSARPVSLVVGLGADYVNRVSAELGGERLHVLQWQGDPARYVADALGLGYLPPIELSPSTRLANVLLGDIDVRGVRGRQGINLLLASALTEWRIRLRQIARSPAWKSLEAAQAEQRSVPGLRSECAPPNWTGCRSAAADAGRSRRRVTSPDAGPRGSGERPAARSRRRPHFCLRTVAARYSTAAAVVRVQLLSQASDSLRQIYACASDSNGPTDGTEIYSESRRQTPGCSCRQWPRQLSQVFCHKTPDWGLDTTLTVL